jgi:hypothetical protein
MLHDKRMAERAGAMDEDDVAVFPPDGCYRLCELLYLVRPRSTITVLISDDASAELDDFHIFIP